MTERHVPARRRAAHAGLLLIAWLWCAPLASHAADERVIERLDITQPRAFGYHIGDRFSREVTLTLRAPYALDMKALPAAGRFSEFLTLDAPRIETTARDGATDYAMRFDYQVVNVGVEAASIAVPHHELVYSNGKESLKALVPATRITVTPLRASDDATLAADAAPRPLHFDATPLWMCALAMGLSVLGLVFIHGRLPAWRRARPFAAAHRQVRAAQARGWRDEDYSAALRAVHHAFNATAGHTVFADALDAFIAAHPPYASLHGALVEFFARSRSHFFHAAEIETPRYSARELTAFIQRCRDAERGLE